MTVLIDGEAVREDISDDDLERLAIASVLASEEDKISVIKELVIDLVETAQEWAPRDSEFEVDKVSIIEEISAAFREWVEALSEDEKKSLAAKIVDAEKAAA